MARSRQLWQHETAPTIHEPWPAPAEPRSQSHRPQGLRCRGRWEETHAKQEKALRDGVGVCHRQGDGELTDRTMRHTSMQVFPLSRSSLSRYFPTFLHLSRFHLFTLSRSPRPELRLRGSGSTRTYTQGRLPVFGSMRYSSHTPGGGRGGGTRTNREGHGAPRGGKARRMEIAGEEGARHGAHDSQTPHLEVSIVIYRLIDILSTHGAFTWDGHQKTGIAPS